jgi:hypothetical protein
MEGRSLSRANYWQRDKGRPSPRCLSRESKLKRYGRKTEDEERQTEQEIEKEKLKIIMPILPLSDKLIIQRKHHIFEATKMKKSSHITTAHIQNFKSTQKRQIGALDLGGKLRKQWKAGDTANSA